MKQIIIILSIIYLIPVIGCEAIAQDGNSGTPITAKDLTSTMDTVSYSVGVLMAENLKKQGLTDVDIAALATAFQDVMSGGELKINAKDAGKIFQSHMQALDAKKFAKNIEEGKTFLAENGKRQEVNTLESGLQYEILKKGEGPSPAATDKVTVHYHGTLLDGTVFDSSVDRGQPASFPVNGVIPGWVEALQLMAVGDKWKLFIPSNLAYGERGAGGAIGPHSTLVFEVELISID